MMCEKHYKKPEPEDACPHLKVQVIVGVHRYLEEIHEVIIKPENEDQAWRKVRDKDPGNKDRKWITESTCMDCGESIDMQKPSGEEFE